MRAEEKNILFFDWFFSYYPLGLKKWSPDFKTLELRLFSKSGRYPSNLENTGFQKSIDDHDQIAKVDNENKMKKNPF